MFLFCLSSISWWFLLVYVDPLPSSVVGKMIWLIFDDRKIEWNIILPLIWILHLYSNAVEFRLCIRGRGRGSSTPAGLPGLLTRLDTLGCFNDRPRGFPVAVRVAADIEQRRQGHTISYNESGRGDHGGRRGRKGAPENGGGGSASISGGRVRRC